MFALSKLETVKLSEIPSLGYLDYTLQCFASQYTRKYARAVKQKVCNEAENRERD